jgi:hypothetical protein
MSKYLLLGLSITLTLASVSVNTMTSWDFAGTLWFIVFVVSMLVSIFEILTK